jgi:hypothetical protein
MDEEGENSDGSKLPTWGGHLWRISLATYRWEHLLRVPEALIAVGVGGRYVYSLGYFGHVLYQYDTQTGKTARAVVGSVDGHISRNFLVDDRGHAYVPRLTADRAVDGRARTVQIALGEFGPDLREIGATPVETARYLGGDPPTESHGIVGLQKMADGSIYFTTHTGFLGRVVPPVPGRADAINHARAEVIQIGWLHPDGPSYAASLFASADGGTLLSLVRRADAPWEWLACTVSGHVCQVATFAAPGREPAVLGRTLLYGSSTRDAKGGHYVVGMGSDYRPVALRVQGLGR